MWRRQFFAIEPTTSISIDRRHGSCREPLEVPAGVIDRYSVGRRARLV
jgi:hypothetical protein